MNKPASTPEHLQPGRSRPLCVGRDPQLETLARRLSAAIEGQGGLLFITGEAGGGKTTLLAEFAHRAQAAHPDLLVVAGVCRSLAPVPEPYQPFRDLLALLAGLQHPLQEIAPLSQPQLFAQATELIKTLSHQRPLLLLLDDLHLIDTASSRLLSHLGRHLANHPILIIGAYQPGEMTGRSGKTHPLAAVLQQSAPRPDDINLNPTQHQQGRDFVDALLDSEPNRLEPGFREALYWRTKGRPLFTVELLRLLELQGDLQSDEDGRWTAAPHLNWGILPARVETVIARRVEHLPPELRRLLEAAAVEGETFSLDVLAEVAGLELPRLHHHLSHELDRHYRLVRQQELMLLGSREIPRYHFRHQLFQQFLYNQLSTAQCRTLHSRTAAALTELRSETLDQLAPTLASHYFVAGKTAEAVPHLYQAGNDARRRLAPEAALQYWETALKYWPPDSPASQAELLHTIGETFLELADFPNAAARLEQAGEEYTAVGSLIGQGIIRRLLGRLNCEQGKRTAALRHYEAALDILRETDHPELARTLSALSHMHLLVGSHHTALAWGDRALHLARRLELPDVIIQAQTNIGTALVAGGEMERGLALLAETAAQAQTLPLPLDACLAFLNSAQSLLLLERVDEGRALFKRLLAYAREIQSQMFESIALIFLTQLDWWAGRWQTALSRLPHLEQWLAGGPPLIPKVWGATLLGQIYNDLGLPDKARAVLVESAQVARSAGDLQSTVPFLSQLARTAQNETELDRLVEEIIILTDGANPGLTNTLPALRLVCGRLTHKSRGDLSSVERLVQAHAVHRSRESAASLHECQALAAARRGEWAVARREYALAAEYWDMAQRPYDHLRLLSSWTDALSIRDSATPHVREQAAALIQHLSAEITDPALKHAFLTCPPAAKLTPTEPPP